MKEWTTRELVENGYEIENGKITSVDLSMADHGCIVLEMTIEGNGCGFIYGGYALGHGYLGADHFGSNDHALVYIMKIMDTVGVARFNELKGKYVRFATNGWGDSVKIIGNIISDKWFDAKSFFEEIELKGDNNAE